ncbi:MAG TPA: helix-turn-helix transcriptional regulator [Elusimicrobiota bacterium]|nr:helix-turn-helix transcriptional regulator [Elusimicrobiota bacterium]
MDSIHIRLGRKLRAERERQGLTQEIVAERCNLSTAFIGQIERGQNAASLTSVERIGRALNVSLSELFSFPETRPSKPSLSSYEKICSLLRGRPKREQEYILATVKTLVRRLRQAGKGKRR